MADYFTRKTIRDISPNHRHAAFFIATGAGAVHATGTQAGRHGCGWPRLSTTGYSVALSGDGYTAVVGGPYAGGPYPVGAAWVFTRSGGVWTQQGSLLKANDASPDRDGDLEGYSVALSSDGNTAIVGGPNDSPYDYGLPATGAAWVYTRSGGVWTQQGPKLVGTGAVGFGGPAQGWSVALSADGNTAIVGGPSDNWDLNSPVGAAVGAAWVYTRSGGVWTQQGPKLVGAGTVGIPFDVRGFSVALSGDGNTAIIGGYGGSRVYTRSGGVWTQQGPQLLGAASSVALSGDGNTAIIGGGGFQGAPGGSWVYTRSGGVWTQQGPQLLGTGAVGNADQGTSVGLSSDGNTALVGGPEDSSYAGAAWVFTRNNGDWTQQGNKLVGTGAVGNAEQGFSVGLSGDGNTAMVGGPSDNSNTGAAWVFVQPVLQVSPTTNIAASGTKGKEFSPASFQYQLTSTIGSVNYAISGIPTWLNANFTSGMATITPVTVTFSLINPGSLSPGTHSADIAFTNTSNGQGNTIRTATLTVSAGTKDGCKDDGWKNYISFPGPFKNQGQCVSYFAQQK